MQNPWLPCNEAKSTSQTSLSEKSFFYYPVSSRSCCCCFLCGGGGWGGVKLAAGWCGHLSIETGEVLDTRHVVLVEVICEVTAMIINT